MFKRSAKRAGFARVQMLPCFFEAADALQAREFFLVGLDALLAGLQFGFLPLQLGDGVLVVTLEFGEPRFALLELMLDFEGLLTEICRLLQPGLAVKALLLAVAPVRVGPALQNILQALAQGIERLLLMRQFGVCRALLCGERIALLGVLLLLLGEVVELAAEFE